MYDLVVIGGTEAGRYAALTAAGHGARVALVEPETEFDRRFRVDGAAIAILAARSRCEDFDPMTEYDRARETAVAGLDRDRSSLSLAVLAIRGVDVIQDNGEFRNSDGLHFAVGNRSLSARSYIIAAACDRVMPDIEGLSATPHLSDRTIGKLFEGDRLPETLTVIGNTPAIVERVAALCELGLRVTLVTGGDRLLPAEDAEVARWVRAILEAGGVRIIEGQPVVQVKQIQGQTWVQAGNNAIDADVLVLATEGIANGDRFGLNAVVERGSTDDRLRCHPQIYTIGEWLGGYPLPEIARYEAAIAVKNALFFPIFPVRYDNLPLVVTNVPTLARVGDSEVRARRRWGDRLVVLKAFDSPIENSEIPTARGFVKLLLHPDGRIVGASATGNRAAEVVKVLAFAKQNRLKMDAIAAFSGVADDIFSQLAQQWQLQSRSWQQILWRKWCALRLSRG